MFSGRKLLIATKHQKEKAIAPILEKELGVIAILASNLDTDVLGTFTGEIERKEDPIATARKKCLMAMTLIDCDLVIASEGSFGPHPVVHFLPANIEFLLFIDKKNDLEIVVKELSTTTNFNASTIKTTAELNSFAMQAGFPEHGLILRKSKDDFSTIEKGITDKELLHEIFNRLCSKYGGAYIETDMRAMYNPTRMNVIGLATQKLLQKINNLCAVCKTPGFAITQSKQGLPCSLCHSKTQSILSYIYTCKKCSYTQEDKFPNGKYAEDPRYCDRCNP